MDILKIAFLTILTLAAIVACEFTGDSITVNTDVNTIVGTGTTTTTATRTVTPFGTPTITPTLKVEEAATVPTPRIF